MSDSQFGATVGGHTSSTDFAHAGVTYRISLLDVGRAADPVLLDAPARDDQVAFRSTLIRAYGKYYAFRYRGAADSPGALAVQSYTVFEQAGSAHSPDAAYGADLYVVVRLPERLLDRGWRWIQVVHWTGSAPAPNSYVDSMGRANPFFMTGGPTTINGKRVLNFANTISVPMMGGPGASVELPTEHFTAELFLVRDTRAKDVSGRDVIDVLAGLKYGWQLHRLAA
jgi:hypothetical protein